MVNLEVQTGKVVRLDRGAELCFDRPLVMGILNITPDSFSDGGKYIDFDAALERAMEIIDQKADIIDVGGESSRPGAEGVPLEEELARVIPAVAAVRRISDIPISVDTVKAEVARQSLMAGADIINDISALRFDPIMAGMLAEAKTPVILMHMLGSPRTMQIAPRYDDCVAELKEFFLERIDFCIRKGIGKDKIIIDPGIGFGKRLQDNLDIIRRIADFKLLGLPVMVGASRKSFIAALMGTEKTPDLRIGGSIASALAAIVNGADIVRVHDVDETVEAIKIFKTIEDSF